MASKTCKDQPLVAKVFARKHAILETTGVLVENCLGCGVNGCVFSVRGSENVLKVSLTQDEAKLAQAFSRRGTTLEFLPRFFGGWTVDGSVVDLPSVFDVGLILREGVEDLKPTSSWSLARFMEEIRHATFDDEEGLKGRLDAIIARADGTLERRDADAVYALASFVLWSERAGLFFDLDEFGGKIGVKNMGVTQDGRVVVRDLGNFEPAEGALEAVATKRDWKRKARNYPATPDVLDKDLWGATKKLLLPPESKRLPVEIGTIDGIKIVLVNGAEVADRWPVFWRGGHDRVYSFIPKRTIWIDGRLPRRFLRYVLYHELVERDRMARHRENYDVAHEFADESEPE